LSVKGFSDGSLRTRRRVFGQVTIVASLSSRLPSVTFASSDDDLDVGPIGSLLDDRVVENSPVSGLNGMAEFRINGVSYEAISGDEPGLRLLINISVIENPPAGKPPGVVLDVEARVTIAGIVVPSWWEDGVRVGEELRMLGGKQMKLFVSLGRDYLRRIESVRVNDVGISTSLVFRYLAGGGVPSPGYPSGSTMLDLSQAKWLAVLEKIGYKASWVIEVERPSVEGWPRATEFLENAHDRIISHDPEGAIAQCRAAWKLLTPLLESKWGELAIEIDRGSTPEKDYPSKSDRIKSLKAGALAWDHTGDHPEHYAASMDDALLAYRVTASLVSYLSRKTVQAENRKKE